MKQVSKNSTGFFTKRDIHKFYERCNSSSKKISFLENAFFERLASDFAVGAHWWEQTTLFGSLLNMHVIICQHESAHVIPQLIQERNNERWLDVHRWNELPAESEKQTTRYVAHRHL